jgi:uncharacterized membrane protein
MGEVIHGLPTLMIITMWRRITLILILGLCLSKDLYWTFKKNQDRDKHAEDLKFFINKIYVDLLNNVPYFFVDLINYQSKTIIKVIKKLIILKKLYTYRNGEMLYLYGDNIIFGIDLKLNLWG